MTQAIAAAVARAADGTLAAWRAVPGGDINAAMRVTLADGRVLFAKHRPEPPEGFYAAEAAGLRWLGAAAAIPVPEVIAVDHAFLALTWVDAGPRTAGFEAALGAGLALLHAAGADAPGGTPGGAPAFLGSIRLPDAPAHDAGAWPAHDAGAWPAHDAGAWPAFYAQRRLAPLLRMAVDRGAVAGRTARRVERVIERIDDLAGPPEPPARLHGDLWSGNVMAGPGGGPVLVDPAAYGGHREVDLAMLRLFGAPGPDLLAAYEDVRPLADGAQERVELWQLLPLLVHAVLFGGSYGAAVDAAARRFVG